MKIIHKAGIIILIILSIIIKHSCKKESVPAVETAAITNITATSATSGGTITSEGTGTVIARGVCWSTGISPGLADMKTSDGDGAGDFTSNISGLEAVTTYYVRAYATNSAGTGYGMTISVTTLGDHPVAITQSATNISEASATLNAAVNANYLTTEVTFEYGTTTEYGLTATALQNPVTGNSSTNVVAEITGLEGGKAYHFRVKTENSLGTSYGDDIVFTTSGSIPTAATQSACCLSSISAKLNGTVNANYLSTAVTFEYGTTASYGNYITAAQSPVTGNSPTSVYANISGLNPGTVYHFRIKAINSLGTTYGDDRSFLTFPVDNDGNVYRYITIGTQVWMPFRMACAD